MALTGQWPRIAATGGCNGSWLALEFPSTPLAIMRSAIGVGRKIGKRPHMGGTSPCGFLLTNHKKGTLNKRRAQF